MEVSFKAPTSSAGVATSRVPGASGGNGGGAGGEGGEGGGNGGDGGGGLASSGHAQPVQSQPYSDSSTAHVSWSCDDQWSHVCPSQVLGQLPASSRRCATAAPTAGLGTPSGTAAGIDG